MRGGCAGHAAKLCRVWPGRPLSVADLVRQLAALAVAEEARLEAHPALAAGAVEKRDVLAGLEVAAAADVVFLAGEVAGEYRPADRQKVLRPDVESGVRPTPLRPARQVDPVGTLVERGE